VVSADGDLDRALRARCDAVVAVAGADLASRVARVVPGAGIDLRDDGRTGALSG
jgi:hypothetical protein